MSKRGADRQITSDDRECSDDDEQNNDVKGIRRAAPEELAQRRYQDESKKFRHEKIKTFCCL